MNSIRPKKTVITYFVNRQQFMSLQGNNPGLIIIKFGASWCAPCRRIKPIVDAFFVSSPDHVVCCEIDVDECADVYAYFKSKKMVNGIPAILAFRRGNTSYIPDASVTGSDPVQLDAFFKQCGQLSM